MWVYTAQQSTGEGCNATYNIKMAARGVGISYV